MAVAVMLTSQKGGNHGNATLVHLMASATLNNQYTYLNHTTGLIFDL